MIASRAAGARRLAGLLAPLLAVVLAVPGGGCGSDGGPAAPSSAGGGGEAHAAAAGVCRVLVAFDRTVAQEVNGASQRITIDTDPARARRLLLEATDQVRSAADFLPERYAALQLGDEGDIGRLVRDASAATAAVDGQLDTITAELEDGLAGADARQILSAVFIDMEKVQSLAQPDQNDYSDPALVRALDSLPDCEHTISR